ncbi:MAG: sporulation membrane protein YtaF [Peptococcaceae bacterium]|nr:sporulation membrane protein YtaF [Peptococcaceae bacterium]
MGIALVIALALSLDGFGVGMAYGLKRIKIPLGSMAIIAFCSALAMATSMLFGQLIMPKLTFVSPKVLGAVILIVIGCYQLIQAFQARREEAVPAMASAVAREESYKTLLSIKLNLFGLVIQILKSPDAADIDGSGTISPNESILLGIALALDTFASGMAATMTGVTLYVILLVAIMQVLMICAGQILTGKLSSGFLKKAKFLPGAVLVLIGSLKMI